MTRTPDTTTAPTWKEYDEGCVKAWHSGEAAERERIERIIEGYSTQAEMDRHGRIATCVCIDLLAAIRNG